MIPVLHPSAETQVGVVMLMEDDEQLVHANGKMGTSERRRSLTLNGETTEFENPVPLVLAAARQLGMSLRRDGKLLWIADEALLDEYEDDDTADSIQSIPEQPLSDDVATYYKNVFAQRSKATVLPSNMIAEMASQHSEALAEIAAAKQHARKSMSKRELKRDRRRRSLALREERLSGVSERYTEERMALLDTDSEGKWSNRSSAGSDQPPSLTSPHTAEPAIWPSDLPLSSGGFSTLKRGALPRIDSSSLALDQLEQAASAPSSAPASAPVPATAPMKSPEPRRRYGSDAFGLATTEPSAPDPNTDHGDTRPLPPRRISEFSSLHNQWARSPRDSPQEEPAAAEATRAPVCASNGGIVSGGSGQHSGQPHFNIGDRVEVDFDDEGWFKGVVETVRAGGRHGDRRVYNVRLDVGETADDVEGSEIRPEGVKGDSGGGSNSRDEQSTRADSLNGFDVNDQASEVSEGPEEERQITCRVTETGIEWNLIRDDEFVWSPPTTSALRQHDDRFPRWEAVKIMTIGTDKPGQSAPTPTRHLIYSNEDEFKEDLGQELPLAVPPLAPPARPPCAS